MEGYHPSHDAEVVMLGAASHQSLNSYRKRLIMNIQLTLLTLFILSVSVPAAGQSAKLEGYVSNDKGARVEGVRIVVTPGGQGETTDGKGNFKIKLPDSARPGQAVQLRVDRDGWVILSPMFGKCETKSVERNAEPLAVVIVPKGSKMALSPARLSDVVAQWAAARVKLRPEVSNPGQEPDKYEFLQEYVTEYGVARDEFLAAGEKWAQIKESDDKEERALKEYWRQNYTRAAQLAEEAARAADEELKQAQQRTTAASLIRRYKLAGSAWRADNKFSEALAAYGKAEEHFESGRISREDFTAEWAEVKLSIANIKGEVGLRAEGAAGPRLLGGAIAAYRQVETFYTRAQMPQDWATMQHNLGIVFHELSRRGEGSESLKYLNDAAAAFRAAMEVYTQAQFPQQWAMTQNNLNVTLRILGGRAGGGECQIDRVSEFPAGGGTRPSLVAKSGGSNENQNPDDNRITRAVFPRHTSNRTRAERGRGTGRHLRCE